MVVDVPPGAIVGLIDDFWQRSATDVGLPGPHGDKGGKFLLVPPDYKGELPKQGYEVRRATMNNYNIMVRGILTNLDKDVPNAVQRIKKMRVYPLSKRNPEPNKFSMSGKATSTLPPEGLEFWARLSAFINNNPVQERDVFFMAMLKPLGIEKGKEFKPDARQRAILAAAADRRCDRTHGALRCGAPLQRRHRHSRHELEVGTAVNPTQQTPTYGQLDERLHYTYGRSTRRRASAS